MKFLLHVLHQIFNLFKDNTIIVLNIAGAFLLPIRPLLIIVGLMIILDTVTGLYRSKKLNQIITSRKLSQVVTKMLLYQISVITFYIIDVYLLGEFTHLFMQTDFLFTKIVSVIFVSIEMVSINENINQVTGVSLFVEFRKLLTRAKYIKDELEDFTESKKDDKN